MGKHPNLEKIAALVSKGQYIELTDAQYEEKTGVPLPKDAYYLKTRSALAHLCRKNGYAIKVQEKRVFLRKVEEK